MAGISSQAGECGGVCRGWGVGVVGVLVEGGEGIEGGALTQIQ